MNISSDTCISRPGGTRGAQGASSIGPSGNSAGAVACRTQPLLHFTVVVRCANHRDSCCKPMTVEGPCQCEAHSRFACPLPLQQYKISSTWKSCRAGSAPCARDLASTAPDKARSCLSEVIDLFAADMIAMRSENVLSPPM